ncbi:adenylate/guanylate cyclase domain-containing protein [Treponema sp.]|uniref:adenylate/guanylate cyclase domain-containing protein n=1 Tax=Treponema sp. TaxID=166 RepID=UPI00298D8DD8|nr:adenylate/guanylate cyclase domain-containing protein [Treponema sp.]MCR5613351.1 adenylate/guanylate cyclase domain-containing protein [Treponema sp.]
MIQSVVNRQVIVGVRINNKSFVSLLNVQSEYPKSLLLYKQDFVNCKISLYACLMQSEIKIEKVYKIGNISIEQNYIDELLENENESSDYKSVVKVVTSLEKNGYLKIQVFIGKNNSFRPLKIYDTNIFDEIESLENQQRDEALLDYGDFVKSTSVNGPSFVEEDLAREGNGIMRESEASALLSDSDFEHAVSGERDDGRAGRSAVRGTNRGADDGDMYYELADSAKRTRFTIGAKLVAIITSILIVVAGSILALVSYYVSMDVLRNAELNNFSANEQLWTSASKKIQAVADNSMLFSGIYFSASKDKALQEKIVDNFFERNTDIVEVILPGDLEIKNNSLMISNSITSESLRAGISANKNSITAAKSGVCKIKNISHYTKAKTAVLFCPVEVKNDDTLETYFDIITVVFTTDSLEDICSSNSIYTHFVIDEKGFLIAGLDSQKVMTCQNVCEYPIVNNYLNSTAHNAQIRFTYDDINYYGAYKVVSDFDCAVVTLVPTSIVLEPVYVTIKRNAFLALSVLFLTSIIVWFFAKSISNPVKALSAAALKIRDGDFNIKIKPHTHDELGLLTTSFMSMSNGLAERARLMDSFGRFTNRVVAEKAMKGELSLGGENKIVTIFFSDIRNFTAMSEKLTANEVVEFLNDYMSRMVKCVTSTNGSVDKFIGDAVMATWGTPLTSGTPKQDAVNAIRCALMMRAELIKFNKEREKEGKNKIQIGCGINTGPVVSGQIGSEERMEYTCIGDTVNLASRTESLNKPLCTDILITEDTYNYVKDVVVVEQMPSVMVKGKSAPVKMYAVVNMPEEQEITGAGVLGFKNMNQVREVLGFAQPNLDGVDLNEDEKKFKIQGK